MSDMDVWAEIRALADDLERLRKTDVGAVGATYTPTYNGATPGVTTYTFQSGAWTRNDNEITVRGQVNWSAATGTGDAQISLPFAPGAGNFTGALWLSSVTFAAGSPELRLSAGDTFFTMISPATNAAGTVVAVEAAGVVVWTVTYFL